MPRALFQVRLLDGSMRLAAGTVEEGPTSLLGRDATIDTLLAGDAPPLDAALSADNEALPEGLSIAAPIGSQEVWAAGVTYLRSRDARVEEAIEATPYDRVYEAERPELFCKCAGWRARGPGDPIAVRGDSTWDVPEPELTLVLDADAHIVGYTIGNDVSSRSIEGENTLYLPQAKSYDGSCSIGPAIVPATEIEPPFTIRMTIDRHGGSVYDDATSTADMRRPFDELASYLGRALTFPVGAFLMTGTGIVPDPPFTLDAGDVVTISVEGIGALTNVVERLVMRA
ncbi:MAG: fumarylacetoacetate hydrolase family protein [Actinomycetota bacterium]|nr:fumarylacetoacetate hydrolase family protein [Actinomycetota bacterium]